MIPVLTSSFFLVLAFAVILAWAAYSDITTLRIPNRIPLAIICLYFLFVFLSPDPVDSLGGLITGLSIFAAGVLLFSFRVMGGGDVKLMASVGFWAGPELVFGFLVVTGLVGGLMALVSCTPLRHAVTYAHTAIFPGFMPAPALKGQIPYGLAIASGGLFVAFRLAQA